jgi:dTDP-4-dehydrorhamnose reductase
MKFKVLVLGVSGLIGSTTFRVLSERDDWSVYGTVRLETVKRWFEAQLADRLIGDVDVVNYERLRHVIENVRPHVIVNCIGATKHKTEGSEPQTAISLNALLPHRLAALCEPIGARLVHVSSDCVFSGNRGDYTEDDLPDASDLYGKSKALGEVLYPHSITLRTSTIGHELNSSFGLLNWFLCQKDSCDGYTRAVFSGLPTVIFARIVRDVVIPRRDLHGLYHVAGPPIAKYELLKLIADVYGKAIDINPVNEPAIDRSLDARRFFAATGYSADDWPRLIELMHTYK